MRSPLFLLGIASAPAPASTGGRRSMLAPWIGGASSTEAAPASGGMRSMLAFWAGGACAGIDTSRPRGGGDKKAKRKRLEESYARIARDDDELAQLLAIITPHL